MIFQNYWVCGLCPSSSILKSKRIQLFRHWIWFCSQVRGQTPTLLGLLERANLNHFLITVCMHTDLTEVKSIGVIKKELWKGFKPLKQTINQYFHITKADILHAWNGVRLISNMCGILYLFCSKKHEIDGILPGKLCFYISTTGSFMYSQRNHIIQCWKNNSLKRLF
jgi:hypothetical protein